MQAALKSVKGVKKAKAKMPNTATVTAAAGKVKVADLIAALKKAGYGASEKKDS